MSEKTVFSVGDKVILHHGGVYGGKSIDEVAEITKAGNIKLKQYTSKMFRSDGYQRGGGPWSRSHIEKATPETLDMVRNEIRRSSILSEIAGYNFKNMPLGRLELIHQVILAQKTEDAKEVSHE